MELFYRVQPECGERLKALLATRGINLTKIADLVGEELSRVSRILNGKYRCSWSRQQWEMLAQPLELTSDQLLEKIGLNGLLDSVPTQPASSSVDDDAVLIQLMELQAGELKPVRRIGCAASLCPTLTGAPAHLIAIQAPDSALAPKIEKGDLVIVDTSETSVLREGVFLLLINSSQLALRYAGIQGDVTFCAAGRWRDLYPPFSVKSSLGVQVLGRAVSIIHSFD